MAQEICFSKRVIDELGLEITMMPNSMVVLVMMMTLTMMMMMTTVMMEKSMIQSAASPKGVLPTSI